MSCFAVLPADVYILLLGNETDTTLAATVPVIVMASQVCRLNVHACTCSQAGNHAHSTAFAQHG